jgi:hypothetical protein
MTHERELGLVRLFSCGGAGINIGSKVAAMLTKQTDQNVFANLDTVYLDTSKANLHAGIPADKLYLVDGKDGSGGIRAENYEDIAPRTREILNLFKPADLNIVVSSGGGGTGAVLASCLTSELLGNDKLTIVVMVGDDATKTWTENTLKTIKSYQNIAINTRKKPVVMYYLQNGRDMNRAAVDARVQDLVSALLLLFSRRNRELDGMDLYNWINFHRVTSYSPNLVALSLFTDKVDTDLNKIGNLISITTLAADGLDPTLAKRPEMQKVGFVDGTFNGKTLSSPYHYVTSDGVFGDVAKHLNKVLDEFKTDEGARVAQANIIGKNDVATDTGVVL